MSGPGQRSGLALECAEGLGLLMVAWLPVCVR